MTTPLLSWKSSSKLGKICKNPENLPYQPRERTGEPVEEIVDENFDVAAERRLASAMRVAGCEDARTVEIVKYLVDKERKAK